MGERIRHLRGTQTQAEFAKELEIDRATLANYEAGRRIPNDSFLKRLSILKNTTVPEILFGAHTTPFQDYLSRINAEVEKQARQRPGFIPRFTISDDELALIVSFRIAMLGGDLLGPLHQIIEHAEKSLETDKLVGVPPYGEEQVKRLKAAVARGYLEEGYDPDAAFFATFGEGPGDKPAGG